MEGLFSILPWRGAILSRQVLLEVLGLNPEVGLKIWSSFNIVLKRKKTENLPGDQNRCSFHGGPYHDGPVEIHR